MQLAPAQAVASSDSAQAWAVGSRLRLEREVEGAYQERLQRRCHNEQLEQRQLYRWGRAAQAQSLKLPSCDEFTQRFGVRYNSHYGYVR